MLDRIEPKTRIFLKNIMRTIFMGLFWMCLQVILGIFLEMGFVEGRFTLTNFIFYFQLAVTLFLLLRYYYGMWKHVLVENKPDES